MIRQVERLGLQENDTDELNRLIYKYCRNEELRKMLELMFFECQYNRTDLDGILILIRALSKEKEKIEQGGSK